MATQIKVGEKFVANLVAGSVTDLVVTLTDGKYTFKCDGVADVVVGVYESTNPVGTPNHSCRIAGVGKYGCRLMNSGDHLVRITAKTSGSFVFMVGHYSILDEIGLKFTHRSN